MNSNFSMLHYISLKFVYRKDSIFKTWEGGIKIRWYHGGLMFIWKDCLYTVESPDTLVEYNVVLNAKQLEKSYNFAQIMLWWKSCGSAMGFLLWVLCRKNTMRYWVCAWTHWGWDEIDAILQTPFSNAFSWMKMFEFQLKFHWSLGPNELISP